MNNDEMGAKRELGRDYPAIPSRASRLHHSGIALSHDDFLAATMRSS